MSEQPFTGADFARLLAATSFTRPYDLRVSRFESGECTLEVRYDPSFDRPDGRIAGSLYMMLADVAMWGAIMSTLGNSAGAPTVTVEMKTSFLRGARAEDVRCTARILKLGKRIVYGTAECVNARGDILTHHTLTYIRPDANGASS